MPNGTNPLRPVPLPTSLSEWDKARVLKKERTINDNVEDIHRALIVHEDQVIRAEYMALIEAVHKADSVEGSLKADDFRAAEMVRDYARENNRDPVVANKKLVPLVYSLCSVVLRRYHYTRNQRARTLGGEFVPDDNE